MSKNTVLFIEPRPIDECIDVLNQYIYYTSVKGTFLIPTNSDSKYVLTGNNTKYTFNIKPSSIVINDENYFRFNTPSIINAYLVVNYIYLDN